MKTLILTTALTLILGLSSCKLSEQLANETPEQKLERRIRIMESQNALNRNNFYIMQNHYNVPYRIY